MGADYPHHVLMLVPTNIFHIPADMNRRDRPKFFDQVGHQTTNASIGNKHFSLNNDLVRLAKIMNNLVKDLKILSFKSF